MLTLPPSRLVKPGPGARVNWEHPLARNLVGCWLMNEGSGLATQDIAGANNGALNGGARWLGGSRGCVLYLDGTNDYVQLAKRTMWTSTTPFTYSVWCATADTGRGLMIGDFSLFDTSNPAVNFELVATTGVPRAFLMPTSAAYKDYSGSTACNTGAWFFCVMVYDGNQGLTLYVNGVAQTVTKTRDDTLSGSLSNASPPRIGIDNRAGAATEYFNGRIGPAVIHSRALQPSEIRQLHEDPYCFIEHPDDTIWLDYSSTGGSALTLNVSDTLNLSDAGTRLASKALSDAISLAESLAKTVGKSAADSIALADAREMVIGLGKTDTLSIGDALAKLVGKPLADSLSLTDQVDAFLLLILAVADTLNLGDSVSRVVGKSVADGLTLNDAVAKELRKQIADTLGLTDLSTAQIVAITAAVNIWLSRKRDTTFKPIERSTTWEADPS